MCIKSCSIYSLCPFFCQFRCLTAVWRRRGLAASSAHCSAVWEVTMPSPPPPPTTTAALCLHLWRRTELHQRWDAQTSSLHREWLQSIRCALIQRPLLLCLTVMWFADVKQKSSQLALSLFLCILYHICLNYCPFVLWFSTSFPLLFVFHLSCPSVTRLRSSLSPVYVWFQSMPSVCVLSHAAWSAAPLYTPIHFWSGSVDSDALCLMDACMRCILYYYWGAWKA